ncbi:TlpA family protein disulfide reductase [Candidatus Woesearchaeota archaeon]|mgnify:CR=1 FL=1|jgi:peroxiredoxin|nr:TlpA family protein disulfide reductase [Candidatus Woesearchaeota archaeon]MBT3538247.1 TlpA family protein disulfide reductase [Candidatus Woesearchaeota archaeon]MBT4697701.1 TlpA family protein disulfide reductase [Candidatus Woesearchaeota archaeon]MBT4717413.1 TlpA family protein disulfide reductase [Candidatus Woesearchaeota archaeon]MBT7105916.1 TlpA family protein disulfide reductase [Candidatus Woesearchaeota archaeon]
MNKTIYWITAVVVVGLLSFFSGMSVGGYGSNIASIEGNLVKETVDLAEAYEFSIETIDGDTVSLTENKNQGLPTVLYFMSSTCSTCAKNWAALNDVYPDYKNKVNFVAVSVDPTDTVDVLKDLREDRNIIFDMSPGNPQLAIKYGVKKQTAKFAIDETGKVVSRHDGALTDDGWRAFFEQL